MMTLETVYLYTAIPLQVVVALIPVLGRAALGKEMAFLPLMMGSVWCALGMGLSWARLARAMFGGAEELGVGGRRKVE
jgi:hypothetical protein